MKRKTKFTALCGLLTALSVVLMLPTFFIPIFTYVAPLFSGLVISVTQNVAGKKWGFGVYVAVGTISLILLSDKEAALTYIAFFGYYPLIKEPLERLKKPVAVFLKYLILRFSENGKRETVEAVEILMLKAEYLFLYFSYQIIVVNDINGGAVNRHRFVSVT